ncbi:acetyltransferase [Roseivirga sp. BDSF3-8]|uniref:acetyltransferase n=1 Tax=Roseivirga sp. BDSF3-8 TaxID=3241598 RepID=UPI003531866C
MKPVVIIGYSGHAYVVCDLLEQLGRQIMGYCDKEAKAVNPFGLRYLGSETEGSTLREIKNSDIFVSVGDNSIRLKISKFLTGHHCTFSTLLHPAAVISAHARIQAGTMAAAGAVVNALAEVGEGVILNSGSIVEHECRVGAYAHIAPGAVLAGNVQVGEGAFVGANAVVKQGIRIGSEAVIGAGAVVIKDVPEGAVVAGNPQRKIRG